MYGQYARQFSYLECVVANKLNSEAIKCACETATADIQSAVPGLPHSPNKHSHHVNPDEWYTCLHYAGPMVAVEFNPQSFLDHQDPSYREEILRVIDHPPQAFFTIG